MATKCTQLRIVLASCALLTACSASPQDASSSSAVHEGLGPAPIIQGADPTRASAGSAGPYLVASYSSGQAPSLDYGASTIYYPADAKPPLAGIVIVPGFLALKILISAWGPFLASNGIVTMLIDTNSILDFPPARATALMSAIDTLKAENTRLGGPLEGKLDTSRMAIAGWSMGGGGALQAANTHPELKAVISMCGWDPLGTFPLDRVPTLMFGGNADGLAGPPMSELFYASIPGTTPKQYFEVEAGTHFVANDPADSLGEIGREGLSWLKVFLEGDDRYRQFLGVRPANASTFESNQSALE